MTHAAGHAMEEVRDRGPQAGREGPVRGGHTRICDRDNALCSGRVHPWGDERRPVPPARCLIDAAELARRLGLARSTVYANAARFGALRLGDGPRAPLRFDYDAALASLPRVGRGVLIEPEGTNPRPRRKAGFTRSGHPLLEGRPRFPEDSDLV